MMECNDFSPFLGFLGVTFASLFANMGAAYGTAKSALGIASLGINDDSSVMKNIIPVVMAGVLGIYGLIVSVIIVQGVKVENYSFHNGCAHLCAGLCCGLSALAAGYAIAVVGDVMVRANYHQPDLFVPMVLILIFAEALGLYGLIIAIIVSQNKVDCMNTSPTPIPTLSPTASFL